MNQKSKTFIFISAMSVLCMHIINKIVFSICTVKNLLHSSDNNYYEWRFGKVRYIKKGNGNPILLLHDLIPGSSSYEYHKIINELSKNCEVYAIDLLGYGLSDKPNITYTNYLYVQLLNDFVKNVIGKRTDIVASGDSTAIAILACHNDAEVFNQMVFINPQSISKLNLIPSKHTKFFKFIIDTPIFGTFIYNILMHKSYLEKNFKEKYFYNQLKINDNDISIYLEAAHTPDYHSKHVFSSYIGNYLNTNIVHALKEINHNIILIGGEEKEENKSILDNYIYYNNAIEKVFIPKTKALPQLEAPEKLLEQLKLYLLK